MDRLTQGLLIMVAVFLGVLTARSLLDQAWVLAALTAVLTAVTVLVLVRSGPVVTRAQRAERSRAAVARCTPERVRAVTADAGAEVVQATRLLRGAEPDLTLADAVALVRDRPPA